MTPRGPVGPAAVLRTKVRFIRGAFLALVSSSIAAGTNLTADDGFEKAMDNLAGRNSSRRDRAAEDLAAMGKKAVPRLTGSFRTADDNLRYRILDVFGRMGTGAAPAVPDLISILGDPDLTLPSSTAEALARIGPPAVPALLKAGRSDNDGLRYWCLFAMGRLETVTEDAVEALVAALSDPNSVIRAVAGESLVSAGSASVPLLADLVEGGELELAADAAEILRRIGTSEADAALARFHGKSRAPTARAKRSLPVARKGKRSGRPSLAVADLKPQGVASSDAAIVSDWLRNEIANTGAFTVVERANMERVLSEHAFQQTGCTTQECAIELGKLLNAQRMVVGSFGKFLGKYVINVRLVDVQSGKVLMARTSEGQDDREITGAIRRLAGELAGEK